MAQLLLNNTKLDLEINTLGIPFRTNKFAPRGPINVEGKKNKDRISHREAGW